MKVEGKIDNCLGCDFLQKNRDYYCGRTGSLIEGTKVCLTGRWIKMPNTLNEWVGLLVKAQLAIEGYEGKKY